MWWYVLESNTIMLYHVVITHRNVYCLWTRKIFESGIKFVFIENFTPAPVGPVKRLGPAQYMIYPSNTHLKLKSREISLAHNERIAQLRLSNRWEILHRASQYHCRALWKDFQTIWQLKWMLWTNEISRDLSLKCVSSGYPILLKPQNIDQTLNSQNKHPSFIVSILGKMDRTVTRPTIN